MTGALHVVVPVVIPVATTLVTPVVIPTVVSVVVPVVTSLVTPVAIPVVVSVVVPVVVPLVAAVLAPGNRDEPLGNVSPLDHHPAAAVIARAEPPAVPVAPVMAIDEEDLLVVVLDDLNAGRDHYDRRRKLEADAGKRELDVDLSERERWCEYEESGEESHVTRMDCPPV